MAELDEEDEEEDGEDPEQPGSQVPASVLTRVTRPALDSRVLLAEGGGSAAHAQAHSQHTLRDLRLQLAQQISVLAAERTHSGPKETLLRGWQTSSIASSGRPAADGRPALPPVSDRRVEALLQKADRVLDGLCRGRGAADAAADPAERSSQPIAPGVPSLEYRSQAGPPTSGRPGRQ